LSINKDYFARLEQNITGQPLMNENYYTRVDQDIPEQLLIITIDQWGLLCSCWSKHSWLLLINEDYYTRVEQNIAD